MDEKQIRLQILVLKTVDWALFIGTVSLGIYSFFYSEKPALLGFAFFFGLLIVNRVGNFTNRIIARMRVNMDIERKRRKIEHI